MHQECFARLQTTALKHIRPDGEIVFRQRGGLQQAQTFGHRQNLALRYGHVLGIRAAVGQAADGIANAPLRHTFTHGNHMARGFQTQNGGSTRRRRIASAALQTIRSVDTCISHFDQHVAGAGLRCGGLRRVHHLGGTASAVFYVAHGRCHGQPLFKEFCLMNEDSTASSIDMG